MTEDENKEVLGNDIDPQSGNFIIPAVELPKQPTKKWSRPTPETRRKIASFFDRRFPDVGSRPSIENFYDAIDPRQVEDINQVNEDQLNQAAAVAAEKFASFCDQTETTREAMGDNFVSFMKEGAGQLGDIQDEEGKEARHKRFRDERAESREG